MYILNFKFIDTLSRKSAKWAYEKQSSDVEGMKPILDLTLKIKQRWRKDKIEYTDCELTEDEWLKKFEYDFKFTYGAIVKGTLLLSVAWLLNILIPTLVVTACFGIIRVFSGGLHFDSYTLYTYISLITLIS
jgi:accessory gene regulator protein AgrB